MTNFQQSFRLQTKKVRCWPARIIGIIGLFLASWLFGYSIMAIPEDPQAIWLSIFIGTMMVGVLIDCIRIGREGLGGSITFFSGTVFCLYILYQMIMLGQSYTEGQTAALAGTLILFLAGILFYVCGRRRRKRKA